MTKSSKCLLHTLNLRNVKKLSFKFFEVISIIRGNMVFCLETIHCRNLNTQCQKRHDATTDVKVNFQICGCVGCMKNMLFLANILFFIFILSMCAMEFTEKLTLIHFILEFV